MADTLEQYQARQAAEYGTYVAAQTIQHNGSTAYNEGQPVPVSNVEKYHYLETGLVRHIDDPAPEQADAEPVPVPEGDPIFLTPAPVDLELPTAEPDPTEDTTEQKD